MKIEKDAPSYTPVTITFETKEELEAIFEIMQSRGKVNMSGRAANMNNEIVNLIAKLDII